MVGWCTDGRMVTDGLTDVSQDRWCADGRTVTDGLTDVAQDRRVGWQTDESWTELREGGWMVHMTDGRG